MSIAVLLCNSEYCVCRIKFSLVRDAFAGLLYSKSFERADEINHYPAQTIHCSKHSMLTKLLNIWESEAVVQYSSIVIMSFLRIAIQSSPARIHVALTNESFMHLLINISEINLSFPSSFASYYLKVKFIKLHYVHVYIRHTIRIILRELHRTIALV